MSNIWSKNKYVEIVIDILVYLMSMNFLHYGQLILPIICLIIFINRKCKFYVKNTKVFIVLCLFGISFFVFSYYLGFYSIMGFCFPLAYYIGSNIIEVNEEKIKKVIYLIIFGMVTHYILNFTYELIRFGWYKTITKATRYDVWLQNEFVPTGTATNSVLILSLSYYLFVYENNIRIKITNIILLVLSIAYTIILRRRLQIAILVIIFTISIIIDCWILKNTKNLKKLKKICLTIVYTSIIFLLLYCFNLFNFRRWLNVNSIFAYVRNNGINNGRLSILLKGIKYLPEYLFGGKNISNIVGMPFHDLLLDIYDYAGVFSTLIMIAYLALVAKNSIRLIKSNRITNSFKLLIIEIYIGYIIMFLLEPLMTGSSLFLIVGILIEACVELLI